MSLRIYLTGRLAVTGPAGTIDEEDLPGRQARLLLAYLVLHGRHPVPNDAIAEVVWGGRPPDSWTGLLKSLVSRTRTALRSAGLPSEALPSGLGTYQLRLPADAWVDVEAGTRAVDRAEARLRQGDLGQAWAEAAVASAITRRPLLPHEDAAWLDDTRERLRSERIRSLDVLIEVWLSRGDTAQAAALATESVGLGPLRESSWRMLMRAHAAGGNPAEALHSFRQCAAVLRGELGVDPTAATVALREEILRGAPSGLVVDERR